MALLYLTYRDIAGSLTHRLSTDKRMLPWVEVAYCGLGFRYGASSCVGVLFVLATSLEDPSLRWGVRCEL